MQREKTSAGVAAGEKRFGSENVVMRVFLGRELFEELPDDEVVVTVERARCWCEKIEEVREVGDLTDSLRRRAVRPPPGWIVLSGAVSKTDALRRQFSGAACS